MTAQDPVVILGAGLTGLSAAYHLDGQPLLVVERELRVGGKARSERKQGHTFDITGHWLHLREQYTKELVTRLMGPDALVEIERRTGIYSHGAMLPYPFQANLHGLPLPVVKECLVGFIEARQAEAAGGTRAPQTFWEYAVARFGRGIARHFFVPYNTKLWGRHPDELTPDWVSRYIPEPDVEQVVGGALGLRQEGLGYNARFLYPRAGGIDALPEAFKREICRRPGVDLELGRDVEAIDLNARRIKLVGRTGWLRYDSLVSTIPLPELLRRIQSVPEEVSQAASCLRWVPWRYLNIGLSRPSPMSEHWVYVPELHIPFFRVGVYSNALDAMAPSNRASLYIELADREGPLDIEAILRHLVTMGAIGAVEDVAFVDERRIEYAYVLFDDAWRHATDTIFTWLDHEQGIRSCGRYGSWIYNSMEDSILQGKEAAQWVKQT